LRTPETYYVKHAYIRFRKIKGIIHYYLCEFISEGKLTDISEGVGSGVIKNESHLQQFLKAKTLKEMLAIHSLGSVSQ